MTITDKKDDEEIELGATPSDALPSTMATAVSNVTPLDPALVHLIENVDVFYIQQKLQWKEGRFVGRWIWCAILFGVPSVLHSVNDVCSLVALDLFSVLLLGLFCSALTQGCWEQPNIYTIMDKNDPELKPKLVSPLSWIPLTGISRIRFW